MRVGFARFAIVLTPISGKIVPSTKLTTSQTKNTTWEIGADGEHTQKIIDNNNAIDFLRKLDKSLENLGEITFCILDEKGKFLMSYPYEKVSIKTRTRQGEETEVVIPELLLPFLEAWLE